MFFLLLHVLCFNQLLVAMFIFTFYYILGAHTETIIL